MVCRMHNVLLSFTMHSFFALRNEQILFAIVSFLVQVFLFVFLLFLLPKHVKPDVVAAFSINCEK